MGLGRGGGYSSLVPLGLSELMKYGCVFRNTCLFVYSHVPIKLIRGIEMVAQNTSKTLFQQHQHSPNTAIPVSASKTEFRGPWSERKVSPTASLKSLN